jgi:hypothetical protein
MALQPARDLSLSLSFCVGYRTGKSGPQVHDAESNPAVAERSCQLALEQQRFQNGGRVFVSFLVRLRTKEMVAIVTGISLAQHNIYIIYYAEPDIYIYVPKIKPLMRNCSIEWSVGFIVTSEVSLLFVKILFGR